jgi:hypothetical protein
MSGLTLESVDFDGATFVPAGTAAGRALAASAGDLSIRFSTLSSKLVGVNNPCTRLRLEGTLSASSCANDGSQASNSCCLNYAVKNETAAVRLKDVLTAPANIATIAVANGQSVADAAALIQSAKLNPVTTSVVLYSPSPSTSARAYVVGETGPVTDGGSIAGLALGAIFVVGSICCFWCLCTRKVIWKQKPGASADTDNLEIVCAARDAHPEPTALEGATFRQPYSPSQADFGQGTGMGGGRAAAADPTPSAASPLRLAQPSSSSSGAAVTPEALAGFLDACSKGATAQVLAALKASPALASAVDPASTHSSIHKAVKSNNVTILKAICDADPAGLNRTDKNGATPLHHAVVYQNLDAITFLVGAGADLAAKDKNGETQVDLARKLFKKGVHKTDAVVTALEALNRK